MIRLVLAPLLAALLLLAPDTNPEDDEHLFVEEPTIAADTLILHVSLTLGGLSGIALMADEAATSAADEAATSAAALLPRRATRTRGPSTALPLPLSLYLSHGPVRAGA